VAQNRDRLFSTDDWVEIYRTADEWEVRLVQATLGNQQIRCRPVPDRETGQTRLLVAPDDEIEAREIVSRIGLAITESQYTTRPEAQEERRHATDEEVPLPRATPTALEELVIAEREGIGRIVHYFEQGYELQVGPEPYGIVEEARWEEFTDFSAQRQEFSILLKHEYPTLFQWLKQKKLMAEFIRLVESTYREVPPPNPRRERQRAPTSDSIDVDDSRVSNLAKLSLGLAIVSLLFIWSDPWYVSFSLALFAFVSGLFSKYRIDNSNGRLKGAWFAFIAGIVACIVIVLALTWKPHRPSPSDASGQAATLFTHSPNV
jgi:hypothetical protein